MVKNPRDIFILTTIAVALTAAALRAAPTTQPAIDIPSFTLGWMTRDAGLPNPFAAATQPATQPTTSPTTAPSKPPTVAAGIDLTPYINQLSAGANVILTPATFDASGKPVVNYTMSGVTTPAANVTVDFNGACVKMTGALPTSSNFQIINPNVTIGGGSIAAACVAFNNFSPTTLIHDLSCPDNVVAKFCVNNVYIPGLAKTIGPVITNCTIGYTTDETIYGVRGINVLNCKIAGAHGQPSCRASPAADGSISEGWRYDNDTFDQSLNGANNNEALTFRQGSGKITNCKFGVGINGKPTAGTYVRLGEVPGQTKPGTKLGTNCPLVTMQNCIFYGVKQGFNPVSIKCGVVADLNAIYVATDATSVPIAMIADGTSSLTTANIFRVPVAPGLTLKPNDVGPSGTIWPAGALTQTGSAIVPAFPTAWPLPAIAPATQPATKPATMPVTTATFPAGPTTQPSN